MWDFNYIYWHCFDKPCSSSVDFDSVCLYTSYTPLVPTSSCQAGMMYRTASLEASLTNWSQSLKWLIDGYNCAELQEVLAMGLVVVMFNIDRCAPWLKVLGLCVLNLHHCIRLAQDEACWGRRWVTAAAFLLRVSYWRVAMRWVEQELRGCSTAASDKLNTRRWSPVVFGNW